MSQPTTQSPADYAAENAERFVRQLCDLLSIPSVSTQPEHSGDCQAAATMLASDLQQIGLHEVTINQTAGHPILTAEWLGAGPDAPTVVIYGHYDVQPADPVELWNSPPFEPTLRGDNLHARGASDDKGQLYAHVKALECLLATNGALPVNVKLLFEGEEESGSANLEPFMREHTQWLAADCAVISDTHMLAPDRPTIVTALRGLCYLQLHVDGPSQDLHSGTYGGAVANPAEALCRIVAQLKDQAGRVTIPGFYEGVLELSQLERDQPDPYDDDHVRQGAGVRELAGEAGYSSYLRIGARPTLEVNGLSGGYSGIGAKTVIPAHASAKVSMRLVAGQQWERIAQLCEEHLPTLAPPGVTLRVERLHGADPSAVDPAAAAVQAAARAMERSFGGQVAFMREGGSIPVVGLFDSLLGMPTVLMGFGLPDDGLHSPNEKFTLSQFHAGIRASIAFLQELAAS